MLAGVVRDDHDVELEARVAPPDGVDVGDVRTLVRYGLHQLHDGGRRPSRVEPSRDVSEGFKTQKVRRSHLPHLLVVVVPEVQRVSRCRQVVL